MAEIHPQLKQDCLMLGEFPLCRLLLLNDANYPWFILVPLRDNIREIYQLTPDDRFQLLQESVYLSRCLQDVFRPDKLNIAALGNVVPQLHIHHIARYTTDASWPAPVWGAVAATPYTEERLVQVKDRLQAWLEHNKDQDFHWF